MSRITFDLIRKRSEHNEGEISTLEEISLHQENIIKIELIDTTCKDLKILLLQYNLISKIENLSRLKRLEYLNLALNNIEAIENLESLESLKKLDLTVNFVGDLRGVKKLRLNKNLEELILTGNPCSYYNGYREYTIATLTQLKELDSQSIERSERIKALQMYAEAEGDIIQGYKEYRKTREAQIRDYHAKACTKEETNKESKNGKFWEQTSRHTPEDRIAIAERCIREEEKRNRQKKSDVRQTKRMPKLFTPDGRAYNLNQAKVPFKLNNEDLNQVILDIGIYRYLDTSYVEVDVQPTYVRVMIKGKVLQLSLPFEVSVTACTAKRNLTTGNLIITMPRLNPLTCIVKPPAKDGDARASRENNRKTTTRCQTTRREYLEIGPPTNELDFSTIVQRSDNTEGRKHEEKPESGKHEKGTIDSNPEVPPLE